MWSSLGSKVRVNFFAQAADINVHQIRAGVEIVVPDFFENRHAPANAARRAHEKFQQPVFARGQFDFRAAALRLVGDGVERQIRHAQDGGFVFAAAPRQRAHAGDEFGEFKRFGQIIIRAGVQTLRPVHSLRRARKAAAPASAFLRSRNWRSTLKPSRPGSMMSSTMASNGVLAAAARASSPLWQTVHGEAFRLKRLADKRGGLLFVFNDQHAHELIICGK